MVTLSPQLFPIASRAIATLIQSMPKGQLAKLGLTRAPFATTAPLLGAALGGAVVTVFAIPSSRKWATEKSKELFASAQQFVVPRESLREIPVSETSPVSTRTAWAPPDSVMI